MIVELHNQQSSRPIIYADAISTYTKDGMFCILIEENGKRVVHKYPMLNIWRVVEEY